MAITFDPPLCETITIIPPALFPQRQTTPILFTAQVSADDYAQLVAAGGCIELWSDIGLSNASNNPDRSWNARKFVDSRRSDEGRLGAYTLSMQLPSHVDDPQAHILYLPIALPPLGSSETLHISFTYRIVYTSGEITWLGEFGQNGGLILKASVAKFLNGLTLSTAWLLDYSQQAYVQEIKDPVEDVEVATINKLSDFHIWGLGRNGFIGDLKNASALIFVPKEAERKLVLRPGYILAASPNVTLSVSANNLVTISGQGILVLRIKNEPQDPAEFIGQILSHCNLDASGWNIFASDINEQAVVISPTLTTLPSRCAIISFWLSRHMAGFIGLDLSLFGTALTKNEAEEFAIIPSSKESIHVLAIQPKQALSAPHFMVNISSKEFTIVPVYRLEGLNADSTHQGWGAAILTDHKVLAPRPFRDVSTPPPSQTVDTSSQSDIWKSDTLSDESEEAVRGEPNSEENIGDDSEEQDGPAEDPGQHPDKLSQKEPNLHDHITSPLEAAQRGLTYLDRGRNISSLYRYLFASLRGIVQLFIMCVLGVRQTPFRGTTSDKIDHAPPLADEGARIFDIDRVSAHSENEREHDVDGEQPPSLTPPGSPSTYLKTDCLGSNNLPTSSGIFRSAARLDISVPESARRPFYSELFPFDANRDNNLLPSTTLVDIVLVPLPNSDRPQNNALIDSAPSHELQSFSLSALEKTISFVDGLGPLSCAITQLQTFWYANGAHAAKHGSPSEPVEPINLTSYLLQYQLYSEDGNEGRLISIDIMPDITSAMQEHSEDEIARHPVGQRKLRRGFEFDSVFRIVC